MHVLVAGCGWLGEAIATALAARGDRVTAVRRTPPRDSALPVTWLAADLAAPGAAARLPRDVDAVVASQSAGGDGEEPYRDAYVRANEALLSLAPRRLVYTGSTGVFGQRDGSDVDERTPVAPASAGARVLVEAEDLVTRAGGVVVRLSGLYGPGRYGVVDRVRGGAMALGPGDDAWTNWCHREDAAAAVLAALDRGRPGAVYHGTDAEPLRRREVVEWIAARLGIPPPRSSRPPPFPANRRILGERTRTELSLAPRFPSLREGLAGVLDRASGSN
jgi:nucleoside-diphosphate-sugar epimerase